MTNLDLMVQTLAEVSGRPVEVVRFAVLSGLVLSGADMAEFMREIADDEAQRLLAGFRKDKAGMLNWLIEGRVRMLRRLHPDGHD